MKKGALFKTVRVVVVLLVSVAIAVVLVQLRPRAEKQARTSNGRLVEVLRTRPQSLPMIVDAYGTVAPREALKLVAEVRGQVVAMHPAFIEGGFVRSGEVLLTIDPRDYELAVRRAKVGVRQARAELDRLAQDILNIKASLALAASDVDLALAEVKRLKKLAGRDMTSQSVLDKADRQYLTSRERLQALENQMALTATSRIRLESQLDMAEVAVEQAMLNLERCRIEAPFDAWVTEKAVETGQHLTVGQAVGGVYRAGAFDIDVKIPVGDLAWFPDTGRAGEGPPARVQYTGTTPPRLWNGRVARVKAALDPTTRTLPVVVEVDEPATSDSLVHAADRMKPGMFVTVSIQGRQVENVHRLPRHLVHDGDTIYLADDLQLRVQPVTILRRFKETVLVSDGLSDGDLVITTPLSGAVPGMRVRIE
ncbi:hemolysin secretion protein D [Desulfosarcina alkanivorans]|uniref:Hemolysin secretion protein D n=1 Tax=Desulfosarcina alkanivorans TaxID=571177 RepID=A0A5K7YVJ0_9BACT|nr:HlyD family efflux transporter periplasmic adaptor subunit [Desulfosarcina alkanivorans]BBO71071.1 hemolysin secretion protein D [Desulfosarcina alkanivorans]